MRRNRLKVEKARLTISIPKQLLEECDLYMENYSAYLTKCLENFLDGVNRRQMANDSSTLHNTKYANRKDLYDHDSTLPDDDDESYEEILQRFQEQRRIWKEQREKEYEEISNKRFSGFQPHEKKGV